MKLLRLHHGAFDIQIGDLYLVLDLLTIFGALLILLIMVSGIVQVVRNRKLEFWQKCNWLIFTVLFPLITPLVFFLINRRRLNRN